jgi:hypothetical protein
MTVTDQIAEVILQDPSVSVRDIARRLGYAEEKTIYYWIQKRGFHGIRAFKRAVLTGQYRGATVAREHMGRPGRLPVADALNKDGAPLLTGETLPVTLDRGRGLFVWRYDGPTVAHIQADDYLVVGPPDLAQAQWVLAARGGEAVIRAVLRLQDASPTLLDPERRQLDGEARPLGTILQLARLYPPAVP